MVGPGKDSEDSRQFAMTEEQIINVNRDIAATLKKHRDPQMMFDLGKLALDKSEFETVIYWWELAAEAGHVQAMMDLAFASQRGQDPVKTVFWFEKAANAGSSDAAFNLGNHYRRLKEFRSARVWYERAFEAGDTDAIEPLVHTNLEPARIQQSIHWVTQLIDHGNTTQLELRDALVRAGQGDTAAMRQIAEMLYSMGSVLQCTLWLDAAQEIENLSAR